MLDYDYSLDATNNRMMYLTFHLYLGYAPKPGELEALMAKFPNLNDPQYVVTAEDKQIISTIQNGQRAVKPLALG